MVVENSERASEAEFIETLYGEPVREPAQRAARRVLVTSLLLVAVVKFDAVIDSTSLFPVKFKQEDVLPTALSAVVLLLLLDYLPRILTEVGLFVEGERRISRFIWDAKIAAATDEARAVDDQVQSSPYDGDPDPDPWWEAVREVRDAAAKAEENLNVRLGRHTVMRGVRLVRAFGGMIVPLVIAVFALWLAGPPHWPVNDAAREIAAPVAVADEPVRENNAGQGPNGGAEGQPAPQQMAPAEASPAAAPSDVPGRSR